MWIIFDRAKAEAAGADLERHELIDWRTREYVEELFQDYHFQETGEDSAAPHRTWAWDLLDEAQRQECRQAVAEAIAAARQDLAETVMDQFRRRGLPQAGDPGSPQS